MDYFLEQQQTKADSQQTKAEDIFQILTQPTHDLPYCHHPPPEWDIDDKWWMYINTALSPKVCSLHYGPPLVLPVPWVWTNV